MKKILEKILEKNFVVRLTPRPSFPFGGGYALDSQ